MQGGRNVRESMEAGRSRDGRRGEVKGNREAKKGEGRKGGLQGDSQEGRW